MRSSKGTRDGDNGEKYKRNYFTTDRVIIAFVTLLLGGGGGSAIKDVVSPSNDIVREEIHSLKQDYTNYKISHEREEQLKDEMLNDKLKRLSEDLKEVKSDVKKILEKE